MHIIMTTTQLTLLLLGVFLCLSLLYILYRWLTSRSPGAQERPHPPLEQVVVDGHEGEEAGREVPGSRPIFTVTSSYDEILSSARSEDDQGVETEERKVLDFENEITGVDGNISDCVTEDKKETRIVYLSNQAIKRHLYLNCRGDKDAERFSTRRNKSSQTDT